VARRKGAALILDFLKILCLSLCTASLGVFFQECLEPGMIFGKYGIWLQAMHRRNWRRKDRWVRYWLKPLGNCVFCNSTWINIGFFLLLMTENAVLLPLSIGLNYLFVKMMAKYI
jgi:hypothetical protein